MSVFRKRKPKTFYQDAKEKIDKSTLKYYAIDLGFNNEKIGKMFGIKGKFIAKLKKEYQVNTPPQRHCSVCGDTYKPFLIKDIPYCYKHYQQIKQYGKIFDRTKYDLNEIKIYGDHAEILLYDNCNEEVARAFIDLEDVDKVKDIKWHLTKTGYVSNKKYGKLHVFLMKTHQLQLTNEKIDHKNRNKLDCQKENLRGANNTENSINRTKSKNKSSQFIGVSLVKDRQKWEAYIRVNKKQIHLGRYANIFDALVARLKAEKEYFGSFAPQQYLFAQFDI